MKKRLVVLLLATLLLLCGCAEAEQEANFPISQEEAVAFLGGALDLEWTASQRYDGNPSLFLSAEEVCEDDFISISLRFDFVNGRYALTHIYGTGLEVGERIAPKGAMSSGVTQAYLNAFEENGVLRIDLDLQSGSEKHNETCESYRGYADPAALEAFTLEGFSMDALLAFLKESIENRDGPIFIPSDGTQYALPQPQLANFKGSKKYDVYTGPGTQYLREANGKATVSTNDWIQVFGEENGWLLIQYHVSGINNRFGWIRCSQEMAGVSVPQLSWADEEGLISKIGMTNDPLRNNVEIEGLDGTRDGRLLATLGEDWVYVETQTDEGKPARAFAGEIAFIRGAKEADLIEDQLYEIAGAMDEMDAHEKPDAQSEVLTRYEGGERVYKDSEENGLACVY